MQSRCESVIFVSLALSQMTPHTWTGKDEEGVLAEAVCRGSPFPCLQGRGTVTALGFPACRQQGRGKSLELLRAVICQGVCSFARAYLHTFNRWPLMGFFLL